MRARLAMCCRHSCVSRRALGADGSGAPARMSAYSRIRPTSDRKRDTSSQSRLQRHKDRQAEALFVTCSENRADRRPWLEICALLLRTGLLYYLPY